MRWLVAIQRGKETLHRSSSLTIRRRPPFSSSRDNSIVVPERQHREFAFLRLQPLLPALDSRRCTLTSVERRSGLSAYPAAIGLMRLGSLFLTLSTRVLTGQHAISADG
jgi:hypothetical protein